MPKYIVYTAFGFWGLYAICMFVFPVVTNIGDWHAVLRVWDRWQVFNLGVFLFTSLSIVYFGGILRERQLYKRRRESMRAYLHVYLKSVVDQVDDNLKLLLTYWYDNELEVESDDYRAYDVQFHLFKGMRNDYIAEFMSYAPADIAKAMYELIHEAQVLNERASDMFPKLGGTERHEPDYFANMIFQLCHVRVHAEAMFYYARLQYDAVEKSFLVPNRYTGALFLEPRALAGDDSLNTYIKETARQRLGLPEKKPKAAANT